LPEEEHSRYKQQGVYNSGNDDPAEQFMLLNKAAGFFPGLECNDNFFEQSLILRAKYRLLPCETERISPLFLITFYAGKTK